MNSGKTPDNSSSEEDGNSISSDSPMSGCQSELSGNASDLNGNAVDSRGSAIDSSGSAAASKQNSGLLPLPDVGDLLFIGIMHILLIKRPTYMFQDGSVGWHLVAGQWIFENHKIPHTDLFSYTFPDKPWVAYEWLFDLVAYLLTLAGGFNLLAVGIAATIAFVLMKVYDRARSLGGPLAITTVVTTIAIFASAIHWLARPHVITFLCLYLFTTRLEDFYRGTIGGAKLLFCLCLTMLLWINCHPSFPFGLMLIFIYFVCALRCCFFPRAEAPPLESLLSLSLSSPPIKKTAILFLAGLLSTFVTFINPYGVELHKYIAEYLHGSTLLANTDEFTSPLKHLSVDDRLFLHALCLGLLIAFFAAGLALSKKRLSLPYFSITIIFTYMALSSVRNIPLYAIVSVPAIASLFAETRAMPSAAHIEKIRLMSVFENSFAKMARPFQEFAAQESRCKMHIIPMIYVLFVTVAALSGGSLAGAKILDCGFSPKEMPTKTLTYLKEHNLPYDCGFNYDNWGGVIRYKLGRRVFIDDRADFYGEKFYSQYGIVAQVEPGWQKVLDDHHVEWILVPTNAKLVKPLKESGIWKIACQDEASCLFVSKEFRN